MISTFEHDRTDHFRMSRAETPIVRPWQGNDSALLTPPVSFWIEGEHRLSQWKLQPGNEDADGLISPTAFALKRLHDFLVQARRAFRNRPPQLIVADGDGGIMIERRDGELLKRIHISDDGAIEFWVFTDSQVTSRQVLVPGL